MPRNPPAPTTALALIRGINVGGKNSLPMPALRTLCKSLGWTNVATHIQSGNVVFTAPATALGPGNAKAAAALEASIDTTHAFRPTVIIRTLADLHTTIATNPFTKEAALDPKHLLVMFLAAAPTAAAKNAVLALNPEPERLAVVMREIFLWYPKGIGQSKFQFSRVEKAIGVPGTCRNWNTVLKVLGMAEAIESAGA